MKHPLLEVENLKKYFYFKGRLIRAVDDVSFAIHPGETLGIVGESGSGKTTLGKTILRLYEKTAGEVYFEKAPIFSLSKEELNKLRPKMQLIFQNTSASLNPRMQVHSILEEALLSSRPLSRPELKKAILNLLGMVGLPEFFLDRYPHEMSGGQRQRIGIARALAVQPRLIVCDEPLTSLDMSSQMQIVRLLTDLQKELKLTYLFITHDLAMAEYVSTQIAVMYMGKIVEYAKPKDLFKNPLHPYTKALLSSTLSTNPITEKKKKRIILKGDPPSPLTALSGCPFQSRCPFAQKICSEKSPFLQEIAEGHFASCHFANKNSFTIS